MTRRQALRRERLLGVLLTGAWNLTMDRLMVLAHIPRRHAVIMLTELEGQHLVRFSWDGHAYRYYLTPAGRENALKQTGLDLPA